MADYYLATAIGQSDNPQQLLVGTATQSTDLELHISTTHSPTKKDVIKFLDVLKQYIIGNGMGTTAGPGVDLPPL